MTNIITLFQPLGSLWDLFLFPLISFSSRFCHIIIHCHSLSLKYSLLYFSLHLFHAHVFLLFLTSLHFLLVVLPNPAAEVPPGGREADLVLERQAHLDGEDGAGAG